MSVDAILIMTNVAPEDWSARIERAPRVIGRSSSADIRIPSRFRSVSPRHALAWLSDDGNAWLQDESSAAGTKINGVWIKSSREVQLAPGDRLRLGEVELVLHFGQALVVAQPQGSEGFEDDGTCVQVDARPDPNRRLLESLTLAELNVVLWVGRGYTRDDELGRLLERSPHTVRTHIASIFRKLSVTSRVELVSWLRRLGGGTTQRGESSPAG